MNSKSVAAISRCLCELLATNDPGAARAIVELSRILEELPIHEGVVTPPHGWVAFSLTAGEWWPCSGFEKTKDPLVLWTRCDDGENGAASCGPSRWPCWAWCSADNAPCIELPDWVENAVAAIWDEEHGAYLEVKEIAP